MMKINVKQRQRVIAMIGTSVLLILCGFDSVFAQWNGTTDIYNTNSGKVGIGTSSPTSKLHVAGDFTSDGVVTSNSDAGYGSGTQLRSWGINKPDSNMYFEWGDNANSTLYITDHWRYTSPVAIMAGNVGIGTTAPSYKFDIFGGTNRNTLSLTGDGDSSGYAGITINALTTTNIPWNRTAQFKLHMRKDSWYGGDGSGPSFIIESVSKNFGFAAPFIIAPNNNIILNGGQGNSTGSNAMSYGNVGVGMTTPVAKLYVAGGGYGQVGNANQGAYALGAQSIAADASIYSYGAICTGNGSGNCAGSNGVVLGIGNASAAVNIPNSGSVIFNNGFNVGIATPTPNSAYKLDVNGEINATGFRINGTPISTGGGGTITAVNAGTGISGGGSSGSVTLMNNDPGSGQNIFKNISAGGSQFSAQSNTDTLAFVGSGGTTVSVSNRQVVINASTSTIPAANVSPGTFPSGTYTIPGDLNVNGTLQGGNIKAKYQDVAEWVPSSEPLPAGTVVILDSRKSNQVTSSTVSYDTRVAGVISAQPGITLGEKSDNKVLVATTGRVRVMVDATKAPINIGDLLVTSDIPGVAMKSEAVNLGGVQIHRPGTLIGKALEPLAKGKGEILVLLSLQ